MPALVTGAESALGRAVVDALLRTGGEVRAWADAGLVDDAGVADLKRRGSKVARGTLDDEGHLETAMEQVHTVVHTRGGPLEEPGAMLDDVATVLSAAIGAGCRRMVWLSWCGAHDPGDVVWLQAARDAEEMLAVAPVESVVIRRALTFAEGDPLLAAHLEVEVAASVHLPVLATDLARVVAEADRPRRTADDAHLVVEVVGPRAVPLGELGSGSGPALPVHTSRVLVLGTPDGPDGITRIVALGDPLR